MEFKSLTNIETSFRQIRLFALVFICLCALVTGFAVWNSYSLSLIHISEPTRPY